MSFFSRFITVTAVILVTVSLRGSIFLCVEKTLAYQYNIDLSEQRMTFHRDTQTEVVTKTNKRPVFVAMTICCQQRVNLSHKLYICTGQVFEFD